MEAIKVTIVFAGGQELIFDLTAEAWEDLAADFLDERDIPTWSGVDDAERAVMLRLDRVIAIVA